MEESHKPRVSIGMPVYNGELYIEQAIDSILAQTFNDFELIISDNASTDGTREICERYVAQDSRVRYYRNDSNLGAAPNFNRTFELAGGEYFKWAAADDILDPTYLEKCVAILDQNPSVVLCHSRSRVIGEQGETLQDYDVFLKTDSIRVQDRLHDLLFIEHRCYEVFGVMRSDILKRTRLIEPYSASDRTLLVGMSLFGQFYEIPEFLFFPRKHANVSVRSHQTSHSRMIWFDPRNQKKILLPSWSLLFGYRNAIGRAPLSPGETLYGYRQLARWMWRKRQKLLQDLNMGAKRKLLTIFRPGRVAVVS
ncbi:MAG: glycosyltransferase [Anaerolineae bacterium]|nr:glycosyltransferase [Anaerolineae bacterium]